MPSTYILEDDNISVLYIVFQISPEMTVKSFSVWGTRVRAAVHQDRMLPAVVFRFVDSGVKLDSVTHGNHDFSFRVDFLQFEFDTVRLVFAWVCVHPRGMRKHNSNEVINNNLPNFFMYNAMLF